MDFHAGGPDPAASPGNRWSAPSSAAFPALALGQAVSLQNLAQQNERLRKQMSEFAERFERGTEVIHQRLLRVERQAQDLPKAFPSRPPASTSRSQTRLPLLPPRLPPPLDWDIELPAVEAAPPPPRPPSPSSPSSVSRRSSLTPSQRRAVPPLQRLHANPRWSSVASPRPRAGCSAATRYCASAWCCCSSARPSSCATPRNGWRCRWSTATPGWRWQRWRCSASAGGCASGAPPGLILQGTGIAVLYLTIFAAMRLHPLISRRGAGPAGGGDDLLGDPRRAAERHGPGGGGGARRLRRADPDLHRQRHAALFSYFALLNAGIFAIAWPRLAAAQPGRLRRHLRHRFRLGTALLHRSCSPAPSRSWPCSS